MIEKLKACIADNDNLHVFSKDDLRKIVAMLEAGEKCVELLAREFPYINPKRGHDTPKGFQFLVPEYRKALAAYEAAKAPS